MGALGRTWVALLAAVAAGTAVLWALGPPPAPGAPATAVAAPQPALLQPSSGFPGADLPRIAPDGRQPSAVYARPPGPVPDGVRGRVAILVTGPGPTPVDWLAVVDRLPDAVSVALSPYAAQPEELAESVRRRGHELWLSVPMEPEGYPLADEGFRSLLTANDPQLNKQNLEWALTRFRGYAGATDAFGAQRGERFAAWAPGLDLLTAELAARGLFWIDARPGAAPGHLSGRDVDVVVPAGAAAAEVGTALHRLEAVGCDHGTALMLLPMPRIPAAERVAEWARHLPRCSALVPASALMPPPAASHGATP